MEIEKHNDYVDDNNNECQEYIHLNMKKDTYTWEEQPSGYYFLAEKAEWIKDNDYMSEMRDL